MVPHPGGNFLTVTSPALFYVGLQVPGCVMAECSCTSLTAAQRGVVGPQWLPFARQQKPLGASRPLVSASCCPQLHPHSLHRLCLRRAGSSVRLSQLSPCSLPARACDAQPRAQHLISHPSKPLLKPCRRCPGSAPAPCDVPGAVGERWARAGLAHQIAPGHCLRFTPS